MSTTFDAVFSSWPAQPMLAIVLLLTEAIYWRGWRLLRRRDSVRWHFGRFAAFTGALVAMYVALASPIETFAPFLLQVHMLQHLLLMMVVPPLVWLSVPFLPMMRGLPAEIRRYWIAPLLRWKFLRRIATAITHPAVALLILVGATWLWHLPGPYETALRCDAWHKAQHACFMVAGLIFWYPVVRPFPARAAWPLWWLAPYLILADLQNTLLSSWFTFSDHPLYRYYAEMPRLGNISALDDQATAGVIMWVPGSVAFLAPLAWIGIGLMRGHAVEKRPVQSLPCFGHSHSAQLRTSNTSLRTVDLLQLPLLGAIVRWQGTRRLVQMTMLLVVVAVIADGLTGTQVGAINLAGVVPWIHWRGFVVIGLLAVGNLFCYGCPFVLPRTVARWVFPKSVKRSWPNALRSKWLAVALVALFLWAYEAFALWNSPWITAWIAIAYFVGVLVIDSIFRDAAFCKYVCPIGQFNFVQSLISPWEVRVRQSSVCTSCHTHDCIHGNSASRGCELQLFQPKKIGNLDCTFCLDCVQACPHDNVGIIAVTPTKNIWHDEIRSGIGRLSQRIDYAALAAVLIFGAFANAAGMVAPVVDNQQKFSDVIGCSSTLFTVTLFYLMSLIVLPVVCIGLAGASSRMLGVLSNSRSPIDSQTVREISCRFVWGLVPLGFGMWAAHYSFHFFTSFDAIVPVTQQFVAKFGMSSIGPPNWVCSCCRPAPDWLLKAELMMLDMGYLTSAYAVWRISCGLAATRDGAVCFSRWQVLKFALPWIVLSTALFALGVWILLQPMQMRGMLPGG